MSFVERLLPRIDSLINKEDRDIMDNAYKTLGRDLIEIGKKIYKIVRNFGDLWLVKECNTENFYILERKSENFFLIPKKSRRPTFILSDLTDEAFTETSEINYRGHLLKLLRCKETKCLYAVDLFPETLDVKYTVRVPSNRAELLMDVKGDIVGVYHDKLGVIHIEKGKIVA